MSDIDEYVATAVERVRDREKRRRLRSGLRERMRNSPLMEGEGFARRVGGCDRWRWRKWYKGVVGGGFGRGESDV